MRCRFHLPLFILLALPLAACRPASSGGGSSDGSSGSGATTSGSAGSTTGQSTSGGATGTSGTGQGTGAGAGAPSSTGNAGGTPAAGSGYLAAADLPFDVLTQHNNPGRTGGILTETVLKPSNINSKLFGQVARLQVDGDVYAQPLFVRHAPLKKGTTDLLLVATEHNSVYAFDTNDLTASPVWQVNLGTSMPMTDFPGETNFSTEIGITGTPVVDSNTGTIYLVSAQRDLNGGTKVFSHWLHALSMEDGSERTGSPVQITAHVAGTGAESEGGVVSFDSSISLQRTAMLLHQGQIFFGASAHGYSTVYHGWLFGYNATTLAQTSVMTTTFDSAQGGIWMSGEGPSVDANGYMYVTTGNGLQADPNTQHQESLLQFTVDANGFTLHDWFTAANWASMDANDLDFGSTGSLMVPGTHMAVSGDKSGHLYFLDTQNLGHIQSGDQQAFAELSMGAGTGFYGSPVYYQGSHGARVYAWAALDTLKSYAVDSDTPSMVDTATLSGSFSMPGGVMSISADANDTTSGIVWATATTAGNASGTVRTGVLYAFAADDLSTPLFTSDQNASRDALGNLGKFCAPTVAGGRVYMATQSKAVAVYGVLTGN